MSYTIDPDAGRSMPTATMKRIAIVVALVVALFAAYMFTLWFVIRQEVEADEVLVLVRKTGRTIPAELGEEFEDQIVLYPELLDKLAVYEGRELPSDPVERDALRAKVTNHYKGVVLEPLKEGRYYPNPYTYRRERQEVTVIDQGEVGVLIRKFGRPLKFPKTVATEPDERGPVAKTLGPGRHYINKLAYEVQKFPAIQIPAGHVGVVTLLSGDEPKVKNTYTVGPGEQGVQRQTL